MPARRGHRSDELGRDRSGECLSRRLRPHAGRRPPVARGLRPRAGDAQPVRVHRAETAHLSRIQQPRRTRPERRRPMEQEHRRPDLRERDRRRGHRGAAGCRVLALRRGRIPRDRPGDRQGLPGGRVLRRPVRFGGSVPQHRNSRRDRHAAFPRRGRWWTGSQQAHQDRRHTDGFAGHALLGTFDRQRAQPRRCLVHRQR